MVQSASELRTKAYPPEKAIEERRNNPASYFVYRRLSWPMTWLSYRLRIRPNQITGLALIFTLLGLARLVLLPDFWGPLFLNIAYVLDQVDGNVARLTGQTSISGLWLDSLVGFLYSTFYLLALAAGLSFEPDFSTLSLIDISLSQDTVLLFGLLGSGAIAVRKMGVKMANEQTSQSQSKSIGFSKKAGWYSLPKVINSFAILALLLASVLGLQVEYLILLSLYQIALSIVVSSVLYRRLDRVS